jgi:putative Ca2+/H+ antiporter (TMEM165/GDT1 family)
LILDANVLVASIALVFIAEIADKTMISTGLFAVQTGLYLQVFIASTMGFLLANLVVAIPMYVLRQCMDLSVAKIAGSTLLAFAGLLMIVKRGDELESVSIKRISVLTCFFVVFLAEMGDKTQLSILSLVALHGSPAPALIGGVLGYTLSNTLFLLALRQLNKLVKVKWHYIKVATGVIMVIVGAMMLIEALLR